MNTDLIDLINLRNEITEKINKLNPDVNYPTETIKAKDRRLKENFFNLYCQGEGIDIGCGNDPLTPNVDTYDQIIDQDHDATFIKEINKQYNFVYSSHCLEDLDDPITGIKNWFNLVKPGGFLIIYIPHRDLFERKKELPSAGNRNHKWFFLIDRNEELCTLGLVPLITNNLENYDIIYVKKCDENYSRTTEYLENGVFKVIAKGEFSIEIVVQKLPNNTSY